jgi:hypothetical protein
MAPGLVKPEPCFYYPLFLKRLQSRVVAHFEIGTVEWRGFSRAEGPTMEPGFSPGFPRLKPRSVRASSSAQRSGASGSPKNSRSWLILNLGNEKR